MFVFVSAAVILKFTFRTFCYRLRLFNLHSSVLFSMNSHRNKLLCTMLFVTRWKQDNMLYLPANLFNAINMTVCLCFQISKVRFKK